MLKQLGSYFIKKSLVFLQANWKRHIHLYNWFVLQRKSHITLIPSKKLQNFLIYTSLDIFDDHFYIRPITKVITSWKVKSGNSE